MGPPPRGTILPILAMDFNWNGKTVIFFLYEDPRRSCNSRTVSYLSRLLNPKLSSVRFTPCTAGAVVPAGVLVLLLSSAFFFSSPSQIYRGRAGVGISGLFKRGLSFSSLDSSPFCYFWGGGRGSGLGGLQSPLHYTKI
ncbi:hypothetical protein KFK09_018422 [Dendrobium nobile]|uniref:Uncharacterized protein n=1 Tax=Dendrobium nobile TaxID=94219 RepID=A0A8T3AUS3_DENNO|nr:hypothetical protein KFK09_018422 [Dendrobium nobile]